MKLPKETVHLIDLEHLRPSPTNPRKTFAGIEELAESIKVHGVLQDILVRPRGETITYDKGLWECDHFEIVAGERRYRAAKLAGLTEMRVKVKPLEDAEVLEIQLIENDQREDVKPTEQGRAYARLVEAVGLAEAARRTGKSVATVRSYAALARCPQLLAEAVDLVGDVSRSVAELVCRLPSDTLRTRAALLVLAGFRTETQHTNDELEELANNAVPLNYEDTRHLIQRHFMRELKAAPFSRKSLELLPSAGSCDACPKRAGNNEEAKAEGVRSDMCLDPECYERKITVHKLNEIGAAAKLLGVEVSDLGLVDLVDDMTPRGFIELDQPLKSDDQYECEKKHEGKTLASLLKSKQISLSDPHYGFDSKHKARVMFPVKSLVTAGIMKRVKKEPRPKPEVKSVQTKNASADGPYVLYRAKINHDRFPLTDLEFDAPENATPESLLEKAAEAFMDWFDSIDWSDSTRVGRTPFIGYERVPDAEANDLTPTKPKRKAVKS